MVNKLIFLFLLFPAILVSGEFTASVSSNQINLGESFILNLMLKDASSQSAPSVQSLKNFFDIASQQQLFSTSIINGHSSSSTTWKFTLIPLREGEIVIPSIQIDSSQGILATKPIMIRVSKGAQAAGVHSSDADDVVLTTEVSNATPYKNEPVAYTVRIVAKKDLADIKMQKFSIENAIVESSGEPKIYQKVVEGVSVGIIEFDYLITPLKAGQLKIPSTVIQGAMPIKRKTQRRSFFDDDFDPFSMMGRYELKPFALTAEETILEVQPAIEGIVPWLPARSVQIEEVWNEAQTFQIGEPFTRSFKIVAEGIKSSQLPNLNDLQISDNYFKIYADKPEMGDEESKGIIKSFRKEQYTLIPQQAGALTLPEISITWWDVAKKEKVVTRIPSRMLHIMPAPENTLKNPVPNPMEEQNSVSATPIAAAQKNPILYGCIAGLVILLIAALIWGIVLQKKIMQIKGGPAKKSDRQEIKLQNLDSNDEKPAKANKREKLPDLNPT